MTAVDFFTYFKKLIEKGIAKKLQFVVEPILAYHVGKICPLKFFAVLLQLFTVLSHYSQILIIDNFGKLIFTLKMIVRKLVKLSYKLKRGLSSFDGWRLYLPKTAFHCSQRRREPNVGSGPAQICLISGFVKSEIDGENAD